MPKKKGSTREILTGRPASILGTAVLVGAIAFSSQGGPNGFDQMLRNDAGLIGSGRAIPDTFGLSPRQLPRGSSRETVDYAIDDGTATAQDLTPVGRMLVTCVGAELSGVRFTLATKKDIAGALSSKNTTYQASEDAITAYDACLPPLEQRAAHGRAIIPLGHAAISMTSGS